MNIAVTPRITSNWTPPVQTADAAQVNALAIVAHDLRGPLTNLSALLDLIEKHSARQNSDGIASCTTRASAIVDNLGDMLSAILDRVKTTGDPLGYVPSAIDGQSVVCQAVEQNQPNANRKDVTLKVTTDAPFPICADGRLLAHALDNLLGNAIKHSVPGGTVACHMERQGSHMVIQVSNQSVGLNELDIRRAFQPFTKLSAKSRTDRTSWGLGLWIVRLIAERHGGTIQGKASDREGNVTFTLSLPV
ncbi:MAG: HAMP domain-containing histidine kinase [Rhodobacteraceae bacterium]|nr:HAMP domain-containing histidine kinase [Paracoccaceae bacterium]